MVTKSLSKNEIEIVNQIENVSDEEQKELENILNSMSDDDKQITHSEIINIDDY